ncbi:YkvA family protein [Virgibacillus sp. 179-BFC.A HS]|uniref:YkvA family protein n=1 Tax=Tigheibacillus jepli TaxID=3035914 RepID=A0ABU5CEA0_9BACI|nr:YkvA family protein [Virgibacillus sp. 179-BFC.A HS]MDY0404634.1 YkvA family protein [Virgibacillus sp. 179-BFC.A HS]
MTIDDWKKKLKELDPAKEIEKYWQSFSESEFLEKLLKYAKIIGVKSTFYSLLLFYAFKSPKTPKKAKLTIAGALGYLILPFDLVPDFIPVVGFADDAAVIVYAVFNVISHIDEQVKSQAHERMKKIFGDNYNEHGEIDDQFKPEM